MTNNYDENSIMKTYLLFYLYILLMTALFDPLSDVVILKL